MPPLRDRLDDVPELALHFLARFAAEEGRRVSGIDQEAMHLLTSYSWPGNVRQLENAMFRAIVLADGPQLTVAEFPQIAAHVEGFRATIPAAPAQVDRRPGVHRPGHAGSRRYRAPHRRGGTSRRWQEFTRHPGRHRRGEIRSLEAMEADMIRLALGRYRGHMTEVAKRLGIGRSTLYRKMREFGLEERVS